MSRMLIATLVFTFAQPTMAEDAKPVFSGPQKGEKLAALKLKGVFGKQADQVQDLIAAAKGKPVVIVFFHEKTRPAFNLTNAVMRFAATRKKDGLHGSIVFLAEDATEMTTWLNRIQRYFPEGINVGISPDGLEGPGAYGLNRNVNLTVLIGKDGKVTDNFALVQPSTESDGPKIFKAIVDVLGGGEVPPVSRFARLPNAKAPQKPAPKRKPESKKRPEPKGR
ncbi:MAG: hypothetical protein O3A00_14870 [Planctomycetota bacterium]|nr:hypothetical protein [Planctomycetota bacterium]